MPPVIGALFAKAEGFVGRASAAAPKAKRALRRAAKALRTAAAKVKKASRGRLSAPCATALAAALAEAQARVGCLADGAATAR